MRTCAKGIPGCEREVPLRLLPYITIHVTDFMPPGAAYILAVPPHEHGDECYAEVTTDHIATYRLFGFRGPIRILACFDRFTRAPEVFAPARLVELWNLPEVAPS